VSLVISFFSETCFSDFIFRTPERIFIAVLPACSACSSFQCGTAVGQAVRWMLSSSPFSLK